MRTQSYLKKTAGVAALLAALLMATGLYWPAPAAHAAAIPQAITSISTDSTVDGQWSQLDFRCGWAVPDGSRPGDTFTLQLPPELRWFGTAAFALKNPDGETVATAASNDSGLVTFTLSDFVASHPLDISGTCWFSTQYVQDPGNGGTKGLNFTAGSGVIRVPVNVKGHCQTDCGPVLPTSPGKAMWWADPGQTELESVFYMPAMTLDSNKVVITDTPAAGMDIDCSRITPRVGRSLDADGNITGPLDNQQYPASITCTPRELTVAWTGLPKGEHVELFVVSKVTDARLDIYQNTGTVAISGQESAVGARTSRTVAGGTGDGTATPSPSPSTTTSPGTSTTTASPSPTTATETTTPAAASSTPTQPAAVVPSSAVPSPAVPSSEVSPSVPSLGSITPAETPEALAVTGAQGPSFLPAAAGLLAVGAALAFAGSRLSARRRGH